MNEKKKRLCCVPVCKGGRFDLVHKFPRVQGRALQWLEAINCPELATIPLTRLSETYQICSRHFRPEDYKHAQSRGLNMNAIPSLNLKDLSQLHMCKNPAPLEYETQDSKEDKLLNQTEQQLNDNVGTEKFEYMDVIPVVEYVTEEPCSEQINLDPPSSEVETSNPVWGSTVFEVMHASYKNKLSLNSLWLRCHCRCSLCYDPILRKSKISPVDIPSGIQPASVQQIDELDVLLIKWEDNHQSEYNVHFLMTSQIQEKSSTFSRMPWHRDSDEIKEFAPIGFNRLIASNNKVKALFRNLSINGVTVVKNIPTESKTMAKLALSHLFPQLHSIHFENFNEVHSDICTNFTYANVDCGLKCFFVTEVVEITLVDGINVARQLKATQARAFRELTRSTVPMEINESNVMWRITAPIIEIDPKTEEIIHFRLDVQRLGLLNTLPLDAIEGFYDSLTQLVKLINAKENQWVLTLHPGTMVLLDNWRIFHKFSSSSGISQCYLERKEFLSRVRFLGVQ